MPRKTAASTDEPSDVAGMTAAVFVIRQKRRFTQRASRRRRLAPVAADYFRCRGGSRLLVEAALAFRCVVGGACVSGGRVGGGRLVGCRGASVGENIRLERCEWEQHAYKLLSFG